MKRHHQVASASSDFGPGSGGKLPKTNTRTTWGCPGLQRLRKICVSIFPQPSQRAVTVTCLLPLGFFSLRCQGTYLISCLEKRKSSLWPFQQLSVTSYNFIRWQGEELPCEGDTPFSKHLCWFLFIIGQNQVPWTPSTVSSKRKNLSLNLCPKRNFYQQERKPKEGMLIRNPVSPHPNQQPCGGTGMNEQSSVGRAANGQGWKVRNHSSEKEGVGQRLVLSRELSIPYPLLPFCLVSKSLQRDCTNFLCQEDVVCIFLYNVADLLGQPLPWKVHKQTTKLTPILL